MTIILDGTKGTTTPGLYSSTTFTGTYADGIVVDYTTGLGRISVGTSDGLAFYNAGVATTELMRIDSSGNVGIGAVPSSSWNSGYKALQIANAGYGSLSGQAGGASAMQLTWGAYATGADTWAYLTTGDTVCQYVMNSALHRWRVAASGTAGNAISWVEAMRIDSSGNLLVGTTSNSANAGINLSIPDLTTKNGINVTNATANTGGSWVTFKNSAGNLAGYIYQSGTTTTVYSTSSDYRMKENVEPMLGGLEKVSRLKPVTYTWKEDGSVGQGFIAHELQEVIPEAVAGKKDAVETYLDEEGNEQTRPIYQGIDTSFLVATLTAAIQEQQAIIEQLRADVETLKGKA